MKKKIILLVLIVALLALPLTACGGEKKAPTAKAIKLADYSVTLDANRTAAKYIRKIPDILRQTS